MPIPVKICLQRLTYYGPEKLPKALERVIADEVNVIEVVYGGHSKEPRVDLDLNETDETISRTQKRYEQRKVAEERKKLGLKYGESYPQMEVDK